MWNIIRTILTHEVKGSAISLMKERVISYNFVRKPPVFLSRIFLLDYQAICKRLTKNMPDLCHYS